MQKSLAYEFAFELPSDPKPAFSLPKLAKMGVTDVLSRKTGVIVGDDVLALFKYAREHQFAIPAIVSSSENELPGIFKL